MNEPKKRGRPTNAEIAARNAVVEGADAELVRAANVLIEAHEAHEAHIGPSMLAQAYAIRVWNNQSESALRPWRIQRVKEALEGQGLSFEGVELP